MNHLSRLLLILSSLSIASAAPPSGWVWNGNHPYQYDLASGNWFFTLVSENDLWAYSFGENGWSVWQEGISAAELTVTASELRNATVIATDNSSGEPRTVRFFPEYFSIVFREAPGQTFFGEYFYQKTGATRGTVTLILDPIWVEGSVYHSTQVLNMVFTSKTEGTYSGTALESFDTVRMTPESFSGSFLIQR